MYVKYPAFHDYKEFIFEYCIIWSLEVKHWPGVLVVFSHLFIDMCEKTWSSSSPITVKTSIVPKSAFMANILLSPMIKILNSTIRNKMHMWLLKSLLPLYIWALLSTVSIPFELCHPPRSALPVLGFFCQVFVHQLWIIWQVGHLDISCVLKSESDTFNILYVRWISLSPASSLYRSDVH